MWENSDLKRVRSAGRAIQSNRKRQSIPSERLQELEAVLKTHFGTNDVTEQMVDEAANIDCLEVIEKCNLHFHIIITVVVTIVKMCLQVNGEYIPHSRAVVQHHMTTKGVSLIKLESRWRQHFIDTMKPRFVNCKIKSNNLRIVLPISVFCLIYGLWTIRLRGWT